MGELKEMMGEFMLSVLDPYVRKLRDAAEAAKKTGRNQGASPSATIGSAQQPARCFGG